LEGSQGGINYPEILQTKKLIAPYGFVNIFATLNFLIKKIHLLLLFFVFICTTAKADEWDLALRKAKKEDKPTILYFFTPHCSYCQAMDSEVLTEKEISASLNKKAVYLRIDVEKREDLARFYGVRGYPTTTFLKPNGQPIIQIPGYIEKSDFKKLLTFVVEKYYKTMNLKEFLRKYVLLVPLQKRPEGFQAFSPVWQG
jgi:thioredoxin-related protein